METGFLGLTIEEMIFAVAMITVAHIIILIEGFKQVLEERRGCNGK